MIVHKSAFGALVALSAALPSAGFAASISFEDLTTRDSFHNLGITDTYLGYEWGYGDVAGSAIWDNSGTGWASATATQQASGGAPGNLTGTSYAWNWNGPLSLWIDFRDERDVTSGDFSFLGPSFSSSSSTVQLFGYDDSMSLLASSSVLNLSGSMQTLSAGLDGARFLEIRGNGGWFSVDNLNVELSVSEVPLPAAGWMLFAAFGALAAVRRRKRA